MSWTHGLGDLATLLRPKRALALFRAAGLEIDSAEPFYLRLKPDESAMAGFVFRGAFGALPGYTRTFDGPRAGTLAGKWAQRRVRPTELGDGIRTLPGGRTVLCLFPNDARLRALPSVARMQKLKRILGKLPGLEGWRVHGSRSMLEPVRYKPERRWIARADLALRRKGRPRRRLPVYLRLFADARGERLDGLVRSLRDAGLEDLLPRPLGSAADGRLYVEEAVPGDPLLDRIARGDADPAALAHALYRLHSAPSPLTRIDAPRDLLQRSEALAVTLAGAHVSLGRAAMQLCRNMRTRLPQRWELGTIHGDLHLHQVLVGPGGPVFVDFERASLGDPLSDVGNFGARLLVHASRAPVRDELLAFYVRFLDAYRSRAAARDHSDLVFYLLAGILDAALLPCRRQTSGWRREAASTLALAEGVTAGGGLAAGWETVYPRRRGPWPAVVRGKAYGVVEPEWQASRIVDPARDPALAGLAAWLQQGELVAFRAGKRATVRLEDRHAKILPEKRRRRQARRYRQIAEALAQAGSTAPRLPELLEATEGALVFATAPGSELFDRLMRGGADHALETVAGALAAFHSLPAATLELPVQAACGRSLEWLDVLARAEPDRARRYAPHAALLAANPPTRFAGEPRILHGDLHDRNILIDGQRTWLLDLDQACAGDPASDIGNLGAHIVLRTLQSRSPISEGRARALRFFRAYRLAGADERDGSPAAWSAHTLFRLACIYPFRRRWRHLADPLLQESTRCLRAPV